MTDQLQTVYDLMRVLANRLAGREVIVRMQDPVTTNSLGTVQINQKGVPIIHIAPWLGEHTISTYLHELAHVRLHADQMTRSNLDQAAPRSVTVSKSDKRPTWEAQADQLRDQWLAYGKAHADPSLPGDEGVLWALINYYQKD